MCKHRHYSFIEEAINEAKKSPNSSKHAALLIHNNKIISRGHSKFKSHYSDNVRNHVYVTNKYTIHAEQDCINKCSNKNIIKESYMILLKITNGDEVEPCYMCKHIIGKYGVRRLFCYTVNKYDYDY